MGGALLMDAFEDHEDHEREEAYDQGESTTCPIHRGMLMRFFLCEGYDQGFDQGNDDGGGGDW